jgi:hypothetical protein
VLLSRHSQLEQYVRLHLDVNTPRTLAVLRPLKLSSTLGNWCLYVPGRHLSGMF